MDENDFSEVFKKNEKGRLKHLDIKQQTEKHDSVAVGVKNRLDFSLKDRKNKRSTLHDNVRDLCPPEGPVGPAYPFSLVPPQYKWPQTRSKTVKTFEFSGATMKPNLRAPVHKRNEAAQENWKMSPKVVITRTTFSGDMIPKCEPTTAEKLRSPKSPIERVAPLTPEQMEQCRTSPCVTISRGKENERREMKWKLTEGLLDPDVREINNVDHFRYQLASETKRIKQMCKKWKAVEEEISSVVGPARLLLNNKLKQLGALVDRCANPHPGAELVTLRDLQGFWDMVFMQVEDVELSFKKLQDMSIQTQEPAGELSVAVHSTQVKKNAAKPAVKKIARPAARSRIKDMIAAARKAKKPQEEQSIPACAAAGEQRMFDGVFFYVRPQVLTPGAVARRPTLRKAVLEDEAKKSTSKISSPFAILIASMLGKQVVELEGFAPLPQTPGRNSPDLSATPVRSILKTPQTTKSANKSVVFSDSVSLEDESRVPGEQKTSNVYTTAAEENSSEPDRNEGETRGSANSKLRCLRPRKKKTKCQTKDDTPKTNSSLESRVPGEQKTSDVYTTAAEENSSEPDRNEGETRGSPNSKLRCLRPRKKKPTSQTKDDTPKTNSSLESRVPGEQKTNDVYTTAAEENSSEPDRNEGETRGSPNSKLRCLRPRKKKPTSQTKDDTPKTNSSLESRVPGEQKTNDVYTTAAEENSSEPDRNEGETRGSPNSKLRCLRPRKNKAITQTKDDTPKTKKNTPKSTGKKSKKLEDGK